MYVCYMFNKYSILPDQNFQYQCGVILNQRGLNPFNPPGRANTEHVNTAKPATRVHCVTPHASPTASCI